VAAYYVKSLVVCVRRTVHLLLKIKKDFDSIKMHGTTVKIVGFMCSVEWEKIIFISLSELGTRAAAVVCKPDRMCKYVCLIVKYKEKLRLISPVILMASRFSVNHQHIWTYFISNQACRIRCPYGAMCVKEWWFSSGILMPFNLARQLSDVEINCCALTKF
jgi:hypothetical protein